MTADRFVCTGASEQRGEAAIATASQVRAWLLVEVHGAWGADAIAESRLGPLLPAGWKADLQRRRIRPICIRPSLRDSVPDTEVRLFFVIAGRPGRNAGAIWTRTVSGLDEVAAATADLRQDEPPAGWQAHDARIALVCTNGKHDQCCANRGRPVIRHLRESRWAEQVWECSHIGGDRFAANLVVLPDSLYFGRVEPADAEAVLDAHAAGEIALPWFRGRSTLSYAEQAVEQALRREFDRRGVDDVTIAPTAAGEVVRAEVAGIGTIAARVERRVEHISDPLTCHGPPDQRVPTFDVTVDLEPDRPAS